MILVSEEAKGMHWLWKKHLLAIAIYSLNAQMAKLSAETNVNPMHRMA